MPLEYRAYNVMPVQEAVTTKSNVEVDVEVRIGIYFMAAISVTEKVVGNMAVVVLVGVMLPRISSSSYVLVSLNHHHRLNLPFENPHAISFVVANLSFTEEDVER
jgi:hypothetical protein